MAPTSRLPARLFSSLRHTRIRTTPPSTYLLSKTPLSKTLHRQSPQRATMATKSSAGEAISQVAHAEGGTTKGSVSAQMQSELTKQMNEKQDTESIPEQDADAKTPGQMISEAAKAEGGPSKGSLSAQMQSELAKQMNEKQDTEPIPEQDSSTMTPGEMISQAAKAEGGPSKGSVSAQMQSELAKQMNEKQDTELLPEQDSSSVTPGDIISQVAKAEGGPSKGSASAQLQSEITKQRNAEQGTGSTAAAVNGTAANPPAGSPAAQARGQHDKEENFVQAAQDIGAKMQNDPSSITSEDAAYLESRESRAMGGTRPPKDSIAAEAKRMAAANEQGTASSTGPQQGSMSSQERSHQDREANFQAAVDAIKPKIENDPDALTKDEANLLHSREHRAHGHTEKGGIAAQAQHIIAEREKKQKSGEVGL